MQIVTKESTSGIGTERENFYPPHTTSAEFRCANSFQILWASLSFLLRDRVLTTEQRPRRPRRIRSQWDMTELLIHCWLPRRSLFLQSRADSAATYTHIDFCMYSEIRCRRSWVSESNLPPRDERWYIEDKNNMRCALTLKYCTNIFNCRLKK